VVGFFGARDVPGSNMIGPVLHDEELFARRRVTCVGQARLTPPPRRGRAASGGPPRLLPVLAGLEAGACASPPARLAQEVVLMGSGRAGSRYTLPACAGARRPPPALGLRR